MSKTFKSTLGTTELELSGYAQSHAGLFISAEDGEELAGFYFDQSTAPALALAILEAAGFNAQFHADGTYQDGDCWQLENVAQIIKDYLSIKDAEAAAAREQAELEQEALELCNEFIEDMGYDRVDSWDGSVPSKKGAWMAVARKAREIEAKRAEK